MSKITESARLEDCTVRIPGACNFNPETVVFAHLDKIRFGKGMGIKAKVDDMDLGAYACSGCHAAIHGTPVSGLTAAEVYAAFLEGCIETIIKLKIKGLVKI